MRPRAWPARWGRFNHRGPVRVGDVDRSPPPPQPPPPSPPPPPPTTPPPTIGFGPLGPGARRGRRRPGRAAGASGRPSSSPASTRRPWGPEPAAARAAPSDMRPSLPPPAPFGLRHQPCVAQRLEPGVQRMARRRTGRPCHGRRPPGAQPVEMPDRARLDRRDQAQDGEGDEGGHDEERDRRGRTRSQRRVRPHRRCPRRPRPPPGSASPR